MTKDPVQMILIEKIRVINARHRDPKKFATIVESIRTQGLKKPIKVSLRRKSEKEESGYDLICGQGRIEAFQELGHSEIPAIVVDVPKEDRLLMSLVENMARRFSSHSDLIDEILRLKEAGYNNTEIGGKLNLSDSIIGGYLALANAKEGRLLSAAIRGSIPINVAIEISKAETPEQQRAFLEGYENGQMKFGSIRLVKRILATRNRAKLKTPKDSQPTENEQATNPEQMVKLYQNETSKIRTLVRKAEACEGKLLTIVTAFKRLLVDSEFVNLLKSQNLGNFPKALAEKLNT